MERRLLQGENNQELGKKETKALTVLEDLLFKRRRLRTGRKAIYFLGFISVNRYLNMLRLDTDLVNVYVVNDEGGLFQTGPTFIHGWFWKNE